MIGFQFVSMNFIGLETSGSERLDDIAAVPWEVHTRGKRGGDETLKTLLSDWSRSVF